MWDIVRCQWGQQEQYLRDGYEPFAVAAEAEAVAMGMNRFTTYIYLRKLITFTATGANGVNWDRQVNWDGQVSWDRKEK